MITKPIGSASGTSGPSGAQTVAARTGGDLSGTLATAMIGEHNRIDLCYHYPAARGVDEQQAFQVGT
jgi:hypothetical protein